MSALLDVAVGGEVPSRGRAVDEVGAGDKGQRAGVVAGGEVGEGESVGVRVRVYARPMSVKGHGFADADGMIRGGNLLVKASSLSPT